MKKRRNGKNSAEVFDGGFLTSCVLLLEIPGINNPKNPGTIGYILVTAGLMLGTTGFLKGNRF